MKIKQFLKSDWRKIVITIVFFIISIFTAYLYVKLSYPSWLMNLDKVLLFPSFFILEILNLRNTPNGVLYFFNFIFWYLFSCLIIWIYDKFRKVKKK